MAPDVIVSPGAAGFGIVSMASERSARPETKSINRWTSSRYWRKISSSISLLSSVGSSGRASPA
jgi:hypothetical protein